MRATGTDAFDDFEATIIVHDTLFTSSVRINTKVRITAGTHTVTTDESSKHVYQQPVMIFIEQGTQEVQVELLNTWDNKVLAVKTLNVMKDILDPKARGDATLYQMKQKSKTALNPKVRLTILLDVDSQMEQGILKAMNVSPEANLVLRQQLHKEQLDQAERASTDAAAGLARCHRVSKVPPSSSPIVGQEISELQLLMKACSGPLEKFGDWGRRSQVYVAVEGPPQRKKYILGIWATEADYEAGRKPSEEIDILKIASVAPDPKRQEVFIVQYVDRNRARTRRNFRRLHRARDVWVEMLQALIKTTHDLKEEERKKHHRERRSRLSEVRA